MSIQNLKILFPIGSIYPSQQGGPSNSVYWLAKALHRAGNDIHVIATSTGTEKHEVKRDTWIKGSFGNVIYTRELSHMLPFKLVYHARKLLKDVQIVHLTSILYPASWIIGTFAVLKGKPVIWSVRGELDDNALVYSRWKKWPVLKYIKKYLARQKLVHFHTTCDEETAYVKRYLRVPDRRIHLVPNYFEIPPRCEHTGEKRYILFLGRIHPVKGLENLIRALALSNCFMSSDLQLQIAGDHYNSYGRAMQKLCAAMNLSDKIKFIGHVEGRTRDSIYAGAYCSVFPSYTENFGNVVLESLAQGTPVIASRGMPWQILEDRQVGMWVENSPEQLAAALDRILSYDQDTMQMMRTGARSLAGEFDISRHLGEWHVVYEDLSG